MAGQIKREEQFHSIRLVCDGEVGLGLPEEERRPRQLLPPPAGATAADLIYRPSVVQSGGRTDGYCSELALILARQTNQVEPSPTKPKLAIAQVAVMIRK